MSRGPPPPAYDGQDGDAFDAAEDGEDALEIPVEVGVHYTALGRKFPGEPDKIALNLSKEGARRALCVAQGHLCHFPGLDSSLEFRVEAVKPWSAYMELRTSDGSPHGISAQDLRLGGSLRVLVAQSPMEECAVSALRLQRARPKAGLKFSTLADVMATEFDLQLEATGGRLPDWLHASKTLGVTFSELREDWLVKLLPQRTPLERTLEVLLAPEQRGGADRKSVSSIDVLGEKLAEVSPQLARPPLGEEPALRKLLETSPYFDVTGEEVRLNLDPPQEEEETPDEPSTVSQPPPLQLQEPRPPLRSGTTGSRPPPTQAPGSDEVPTGPRPNTRDRRYGRAMKVLDELSRVNTDALKLSRDKRRVADECLDGTDGGVATQLIEAFRAMPDYAAQLEDEVNTATRDGSVERTRSQEWLNATTSHCQRVRDLLDLFERRPDECDAAELTQRLTQARHGLRDFQREVVDEVTEALSGGGGPAPTAPQPPRLVDAPTSGGRNGAHGNRADSRETIREQRPPPGRRPQNGRGPLTAPSTGNSGRLRADSREGGQSGGPGGRRRGQEKQDDSKSRSPPPAGGNDTEEIRLNVEEVYEVRSSEGDWYPATIRRLKRNGRYEVDLFGGGVAVLYPNVKGQDIRVRRRARPTTAGGHRRGGPANNHGDSRDGSRARSRGNSRTKGRPSGKGQRRGRR